ncbi:MAG: hypothetical protein R3349_02880 [Geminicoccaceae bacterium]|nr:hypothetical protein [Geminicoccaceae bacterium]
MIDEEDREPASAYGPWPWIAGLILAVVLMALMFSLASGRL